MNSENLVIDLSSEDEDCMVVGVHHIGNRTGEIIINFYNEKKVEDKLNNTAQSGILTPNLSSEIQVTSVYNKFNNSLGSANEYLSLNTETLPHKIHEQHISFYLRQANQENLCSFRSNKLASESNTNNCDFEREETGEENLGIFQNKTNLVQTTSTNQFQYQQDIALLDTIASKIALSFKNSHSCKNSKLIKKPSKRLAKRQIPFSTEFPSRLVPMEKKDANKCTESQARIKQESTSHKLNSYTRRNREKLHPVKSTKSAIKSTKRINIAKGEKNKHSIRSIEVSNMLNDNKFSVETRADLKGSSLLNRKPLSRKIKLTSVPKKSKRKNETVFSISQDSSSSVIPLGKKDKDRFVKVPTDSQSLIISSKRYKKKEVRDESKKTSSTSRSFNLTKGSKDVYSNVSLAFNDKLIAKNSPKEEAVCSPGDISQTQNMNCKRKAMLTTEQRRSSRKTKYQFLSGLGLSSSLMPLKIANKINEFPVEFEETLKYSSSNISRIKVQDENTTSKSGKTTYMTRARKKIDGFNSLMNNENSLIKAGIYSTEETSRSQNSKKRILKTEHKQSVLPCNDFYNSCNKNSSEQLGLLGQKPHLVKRKRGRQRKTQKPLIDPSIEKHMQGRPKKIKWKGQSGKGELKIVNKINSQSSLYPSSNFTNTQFDIENYPECEFGFELTTKTCYYDKKHHLKKKIVRELQTNKMHLSTRELDAISNITTNVNSFQVECRISLVDINNHSSQIYTPSTNILYLRNTSKANFHNNIKFAKHQIFPTVKLPSEPSKNLLNHKGLFQKMFDTDTIKQCQAMGNILLSTLISQNLKNIGNCTGMVNQLSSESSQVELMKCQLSQKAKNTKFRCLYAKFLKKLKNENCSSDTIQHLIIVWFLNIFSSAFRRSEYFFSLDEAKSAILSIVGSGNVSEVFDCDSSSFETKCLGVLDLLNWPNHPMIKK